MFKQKSDTPPAEPADPVHQARTRARQRLIGAVILLAIGILGFPLVFETQPRPIPVDIPIEIPKKDAVPPLVAPLATPASAAAIAAAPAPRPAPTLPPAAAKPNEAIVIESRSEADREVAAAPRAAPSAPSRAAPSAAAPSEPRHVAVAAPTPAKPAASTARPEGDGERARALLEGRSAAASDTQRFVVQVGAFADAEAARETRLKVERLGLKTYTQVAQTPSGSRIRVRVGPFASRGDAEAALAKAKAAGMTAVVLTL
ncbi:MAG: SPOR domain-containing protein [Caldimonas sp.]